MFIFSKAFELQQTLLNLKMQGKRIALVPTMGNLHAGHLSLAQTANQMADIVVVSIFVNPTQFGPNEDFAAYPRTFEEDCLKLQKVVIKPLYIFAPQDATLYDIDFSTWVNEEKLSLPLCGASRVGHFRGVCTVVAKLFNICQPHIAIFGQKDAQQCLVIARMIRDLNFPIKMVVNPIVREEGGLALSSRNQYLTEDEKQRALVINQQLFQAQKENPYDLATLRKKIQTYFEIAGGKVDYIQTVSIHSLNSCDILTEEVLLAVAVYFGKTRLIDNVFLKPIQE